MIARDVMRRYVVTASESETISEVADKLAKHRTSGLPVVNSRDELVGMISESDIIKRFTSTITGTSGRKLLTSLAHSLDLLDTLRKEDYQKGEKLFSRLRHTPVSEVMTKKIVAASPMDTIQRVAGLMTEHNVNRVPIIDEGKLIGIVGRTDVVRRVQSMDMTTTPKV
ncbi:MAG: CBS domain-containing protein [Thermoplasmata archaeon]